MTNKELLIHQLNIKKRHLEELQNDLRILVPFNSPYKKHNELMETSERVRFTKGQIDIIEEILITQYQMTYKELLEVSNE